MKYHLYSYIYLFLIIGNLGCDNSTNLGNQIEEKESSFLIGQWYTDDDRSPHWIMFDSLSNYYRWSFNEEVPRIPTAKYTLVDSLIYFEYPELKGLPLPDTTGFDVPLFIDSISINTFSILPIKGEMPTFIYKRDTFDGPQYVELYFFYLNEEEVDSLADLDQNNILRQYDKALKNLNDINLALEHSSVGITVDDSRYITMRDKKIYDKFDYGGFGIIFFRNDSTYVHRGIPTKEDFFKTADDFFPISVHSF